MKPQNVLLTSDGKAKVGDLGIARARGTLQLTGANEAVGTADYLAPEQAQGAAVGPSADDYSVEVVLYEMLAVRLLV